MSLILFFFSDGKLENKLKIWFLNEQSKMRQYDARYDASYDVNIFCSNFLYIVDEKFFLNLK